ncbi:MAG: type I glyceraldehyde-3-phosphate dehydrogenase [Candidatus Magasanikbacteria bacterium]|nr:type I glyceraldehyde-3-phosphate dehydrogenase [Candidatus Magasanikbacteria bacterium]|tara:strand:- start:2774 stop:3772 length:999 start_codon:yes stop_codon:yes gene_type:complete
MNVAINGFGRIGRQFLKACIKKNAPFSIVAINDLTTPKNLAYLLQYDSAQSTSDLVISYTEDSLTVNGTTYHIYAEKDPSALPWKKHNIDVVVECTGFFTKEEGAKLHIQAGAKKVLISAPGKTDTIPTYLCSVNDSDVQDVDTIISNASCTTNCIAPVIDMVHKKYGVQKSLMTTIHAATATQRVVDGPSTKDLRYGRSVLNNMIPTSTGAAKATTKIIRDLAGKFDGVSVRVPVITGSISDITLLLNTQTTAEELNAFFVDSAKSEKYKHIVTTTDEPLVSSDIVGNTHSAIIDLAMTRVVGGDLVKVMAWYDNEWGYANRLVELVQKMS